MIRPTAVAILFTAALSANAMAIEKGAVIGTNPASRLPAGETLAPEDDHIGTQLTKSECTKLGGTVRKYSVCGSGEVCSRKDENGKNHHVCISKKKAE